MPTDTYAPTCVAFVADYYTTPRRVLVDAARAADAGNRRVERAFGRLIELSLALEDGRAPERDVRAAEAEVISAYCTVLDDEVDGTMIRAWRAEAGRAGDRETVEIAERALAGDEAAIRCVAARECDARASRE